jgi:chaperonin GroEL
MRGILKVAAVKAPDFGERRLLILEDIATITGGTVVSPQKGMKLDKFNKTWFGSARTITVGKDATTIIDGKGDTTAIETRVLELKAQIDKSSSPYEIEKLQERLAKMIGGVAIINVGGGTDIEMKEKKDRLDDALQATQAALDEGILPGAGVALLQARKALKDDLDGKNDISKGAAIVFAACGKPFKQILENAGEDASEWLMQLLKTKNMVPNIAEGKIVDAFDAGIIDPTKVVRSALENAAAAAVTLLMTECVIHDKPDTKKKVEDFGMAEMGM